MKTEATTNPNQDLRAERFAAYEQSAEGLWMFETAVPISTSASPDDILLYWKEHAYLSECNDNLAHMYGFNKADELIGARLSDLMAFDDNTWLEYMRGFIRNGFRSAGVETKEYDRYGNLVYFINNMQGIVEDGMLKRVWGTQQDITELRTTNEKAFYFARLVETVSDIIISWDAAHRIVSWNHAASATYGYTYREAHGKKLEEVIDISYEGLTPGHFWSIIETKGEWRGQAVVRTKSGKTVHVLMDVSPIRNDQFERTGFVAISKDITEKLKTEEQLQRSEAFYKSLISDSIDGMLLTDKAGQVRFASPSITKILGYEASEVLEGTLFAFVHPEDLASAISAFGDEVKKEPRVKFISIRLRKKNGTWLWCMVRGHNLLDNPNVQGMVIYFADDSRRRQADSEIEELNKRVLWQKQEIIEQEMRKQKELTKATIDGQEKERQEIGKELHDNVNQHLSTTRLLLEVAREKAEGEMLDLIHLCHRNLSSMISEIKRLSQALVPPTLGDLGLVESVMELCDTLRRTQSFEVELYYRYFDEQHIPDNTKLMLFRIIQEQVSNIIRHSAATRVQIRLQSDAEYIMITVSDNGRGFDPAINKKGLGFNNINNRAGLMNGKVELETAQGKGCMLTVVVPCVLEVELDS